VKKILIIGSQGYLGSHLTDYLQDLGYICTGADIGFFKYGVLYHPKPVPMLPKEAHSLSQQDLEGFDVVIQLAGISNDPFGNFNPQTIYDPTRDYALNIAQICKNLGIRYLFPSSCSIYGIGEGMLDEKGPTKPQTQYSVNKLQIEQGMEELADKNFSPIALRLATVFGCSPRIRFDVVINMLCGMAVAQGKVVLNSNGQAWRPHVYIEDVCEAFRCCIDWEYNGDKLLILNVGRNDNNWKILDVARLIQRNVNGCELEFLGQSNENDANDLIKDRKIQDGVDKRTYQVSFDRIHKILPGFQALWNIEQGVDLLLKDLKRWKLNETKFKQREFYRLQHIEFLHQTRQIDDNLRFN
jgi:nucleoside-diphosphate-sugar epimerase